MTLFPTSALPTAFFLAALSSASAFGQAPFQLASAPPTAPLGALRTSYLPAAIASSSSLPDAPSSLLDTLQSSSQTTQETDEQRKDRERLEGEAQVDRQVHQRNFGIIPNFNTVIGGLPPPLSPRQKFEVVFHTTTDPYTFAIAFVVAGFGELSPPNQGYGWGASGYFYRFGTAYADNVDGALWGNAILPVILHQDPRYYRKATGSIKSRILYSALSTIICRGDNGQRQFNISNVAGNLIAGGISNIYYPSEQRGIGLVFSNGLTVTAEGAVGAQLLEFAPDITGYIHRRREHHRMMLQQKAHPNGSPSGTPDDDL
ncbi:hypothetical protein FTO74_11555 [Granulicella sp. WH15]|uniref:hypothetical protein n=1 Tax=Granulicella sp. WH15 TaxID=2602070 RepID=UPI00136791CF|nr:hypothetical protein [Granulicella sp. WH15]QHN03935.1 hypothetical protein FTO74_11555 [Granulicella sp. WH15]